MDAQTATGLFDRNAFEKSGAFLIRYGLVLVLAWIGAMKFTAYEAEGIKALVETSPLMSCLHSWQRLPFCFRCRVGSRVSAAFRRFPAPADSC